MKKVNLGFSKIDSNVIAYDFVAHRNRKKYSEQLIDKTRGAIVLVPEDETGNPIGVIRVEKEESKNIALLRIVILNPSYIKDAESWMLYILPNVIETVLRPLNVTRVYTNLHPTMTTAIDGYLNLGFKRLAKSECLRAKGLIFAFTVP